MKSYPILMGDVIASRKYRGTSLGRALRAIVASCNRDLGSDILSPYTVTLGDEFQGVACSLQSALRAIFFLEEARLARKIDFRLRYVLHYGAISTPINRDIAHGMMGRGLTRARQMLTSKRRSVPRFQFELPDEKLARQLTRLFAALDGLMTGWRKKDHRLILNMLAEDNDQEVGKRHGKNRSQIWKRRKRLHINEYKMLKDAILDLVP